MIRRLRAQPAHEPAGESSEHQSRFRRERNVRRDTNEDAEGEADPGADDEERPRLPPVGVALASMPAILVGRSRAVNRQRASTKASTTIKAVSAAPRIALRKIASVR